MEKETKSYTRDLYAIFFYFFGGRGTKEEDFSFISYLFFHGGRRRRVEGGRNENKVNLDLGKVGSSCGEQREERKRLWCNGCSTVKWEGGREGGWSRHRRNGDGDCANQISCRQ